MENYTSEKINEPKQNIHLGKYEKHDAELNNGEWFHFYKAQK